MMKRHRARLGRIILASAVLCFSGRSQADPAPEKFVKATREQSTAAIEIYKKNGSEIADRLGIRFQVLETPHFLVFTDWDPREYAFLKENVELAYTCVSKQFQIPITENVFMGKLPIYMFTKREEFEKFSLEIDKLDSTKLAGYYTGNRKGYGHMAMWKPDVKAAGGDTRAAEKQWGHVLVHEFTHAFIARYRTDGQIPRWLNEGVAEVVSYQQFPRSGVYAFCRMMSKGTKFLSIFDAKDIASFTGDDYPLAQAAVETMIAGGPKNFLQYFNDIKDGMDPDDALKKNYHTDKEGLQEAWRKYLKTVNDVNDTGRRRN